MTCLFFYDFSNFYHPTVSMLDAFDDLPIESFTFTDCFDWDSN